MDEQLIVDYKTFIELIAAQNGLSHTETDAIVKEILLQIANNIKEDKIIRFSKFGKFFTRETGGKKRPRFKALKNLKEIVNK